jgi:hypothetical protein
MFTDGIDRQRGRQDGQLQQNPLTWQTVLLCGSNVPMLEVLGAAGGSDAMMYRILEVHPTLPPGLSNNGEKLRRILKANSGQAGDRYLKYLGMTEVMAYVKHYLEKYYDQITTRGGFDRKARFLVRLLSAVRVAGEIIKKAGILHCSPERMMEWGIEKAHEQLNDKVPENSADPLVAYLNYFHDDILTVLSDGKRAGSILHAPRREIRGRFETETRNLYIALPLFRKWLAEKDYAWRELKAGLTNDGYLDQIKLVTLTAGTDKPGGQLQCLQLRAERLGFCFDREKKLNVVELKKA